MPTERRRRPGSEAASAAVNVWDPSAPTPPSPESTPAAEARGVDVADPDLVAALHQLANEKLLPPTPLAAWSSALVPEAPSGGLGKENFVGMCIGDEFTEGSPTGRKVVKVFVRRKTADAERILPAARLDKTYRFNNRDVPVDVEEIASVFLLHYWGFEYPVRGGGSIGNSRTGATGTLGCLVALEEEDYLCLLSNNHVLGSPADPNARQWLGRDIMIAPGPAERDFRSYQAGILHNFADIDFRGGPNLVDAAVARTNFEAASPLHHLYTLNPHLIAPRLGMLVKKEGRTTGPTLGVVTGVLGYLDVPYGPSDGPPFARFQQQIVVQGFGGPFSDRGDSGSLVVDKDTNEPVGLLFAGGRGRDGQDYTFVNPITEVRSRLRISRFLNQTVPVRT